MVLGLRTTPAGQVGVFPEQAANWDWIGKRVRAAQRPLKVLNLFAYTGGSTLAAAAAGAEVVHVDAARNVVQWARDNADLSGLSEAPIRWIDEDAGKFVRRELRRGNRYDAVILDPPSYGHGPKGEPWKIVQHLPGLLADCADVTKGQLAFVVLSCHSPGFGPAELEALVHDAFFGACQQGAVGRDMWLRSTDGRGLTAGSVARWPEMNPIDRND
jgi:23S rRNA (cytosine1962-C5)-methyltransferase